ncbi:MAG: hypothetical protein HKP55_10340, partial [Gammaproteobacteria bacterium]|nr:hypothetical protein [Gammaproteobacteria bacterium]
MSPENTAKTESEVSEESANDSQFDLNSSELFLNRELTWLEFNRRVLHEANDGRNPLLE